jgi:flagellar L-ring protein precursor FlgH
MGMKKLLLAFLMFATISFQETMAQNPMEYAGRSIFSDVRSYQVNDVLTIIISEVSRGVNEAQTNQDKDHRAKLSVGPGKGYLDFLDGFGLDMDNELEYGARASTSRNNVLQAQITATVKEVADNGNLFIEGHKEILINGEAQEIMISGIVRPVDVQANNTILSSKVADLSVRFSGKGTVAAGSSPGFLAKIFHFIF